MTNCLAQCTFNYWNGNCYTNHNMWLLIFKSTLYIVCIKSEKLNSLQGNNSFNPLTPMNDQDRISPYNINTISSRQEMRIWKNINYRIISWLNTKFSKLTSLELYGRQYGELLIRSWELKGEGSSPMSQMLVAYICSYKSDLIYQLVLIS